MPDAGEAEDSLSRKASPTRVLRCQRAPAWRVASKERNQPAASCELPAILAGNGRSLDLDSHGWCYCPPGAGAGAGFLVCGANSGFRDKIVDRAHRPLVVARQAPPGPGAALRSPDP